MFRSVVRRDCSLTLQQEVICGLCDSFFTCSDPGVEGGGGGYSIYLWVGGKQNSDI